MLRSRELNLMSHWALNPVDETLREMIACSLDVFGFIVVVVFATFTVSFNSGQF